MSQTTAKPEDKTTRTTVPQWLKKRAEGSGLPLLSDACKTGKKLGRGQSSLVEEVIYNGEVCAMKVPATYYKKFRLYKEAITLATLKHPHILKLIGVTAVGDDERISIVFEKCATTLSHFLRSSWKETVPLQLKLQILQQVSEAVQYLHTQEPPMVHCDITGTNIYLTDEYQVKLGDFGSAHRLHGDLNALTAQRAVHRSISIQDMYARRPTSSDIFAIGVLIIEVISHQHPIPTEYIDVKTSVLYTDFQRRQKYIDRFTAEEKEHFVPTIKQCLTASENDRPSASGLVTRIQEIRFTLGISDKLVTAEDLNLPSPRNLFPAPPQNVAHSFKGLHPFRLADVHDVGVALSDGSFSVVYEVECNQRICAAKEFMVYDHKPEAINQTAELLARECRHWLELKHPHIVETLGWYEKDTSPFPIIVMEKLDKSLKAHLVSYNKDQFPFVEKVAILLQVATGIQFLHTCSPPLIHGDITANNVMLKGSPPHCTAKLADFGLTRVFDLKSISRQSVGRETYAYISPEFFTQPPAITEKTDNFCFGILLIHAIIHEHPKPIAPATWEGGYLKTRTELERRQQHIDCFTVQERHCLKDIIRHCLEQDPEKRPTSTAILRQMAAVKDKLVTQQEHPSPEMLPSSCKHQMAKGRTVSTATEEDTQSRVQLVQAIKQLSSEYKSRFTADWCISIIRAEEILSEYAVAAIEAEESTIEKTVKLFLALQQVDVDNIKRFCLAIINNSAFPPGTPEHEFARRLLDKIEPQQQSSDDSV